MPPRVTYTETGDTKLWHGWGVTDGRARREVPREVTLAGAE
jgi:hypothetical protein